MIDSTVRTIIIDGVRIIIHVKNSVPMQSTIVTKERGILIEEMEKMLITWIEDVQQQIPISLKSFSGS